MTIKPPLDENTFATLRATMGDDFIPELIEVYLEEMPSLFKSLHESLAVGNVKAFERAAHSIKSSSASLGALDFSAQARELEMIGKSGDLSQAADPLARFIAAYPEVEQALKDVELN